MANCCRINGRLPESHNLTGADHTGSLAEAKYRDLNPQRSFNASGNA